jgi:hypothetical protein
MTTTRGLVTAIGEVDLAPAVRDGSRASPSGRATQAASPR